MRLPNAHQAMVERQKITEYLLATDNPSDPSKPDFFLRFGFSGDNWPAFAEALRLQGVNNEVVKIDETVYGPRYHVGWYYRDAGWPKPVDKDRMAD